MKDIVKLFYGGIREDGIAKSALNQLSSPIENFSEKSIKFFKEKN
jgi:hypothetical protein